MVTIRDEEGNVVFKGDVNAGETVVDPSASETGEFEVEDGGDDNGGDGGGGDVGAVQRPSEIDPETGKKEKVGGPVSSVEQRLIEQGDLTREEARTQEVTRFRETSGGDIEVVDQRQATPAERRGDTQQQQQPGDGGDAAVQKPTQQPVETRQEQARTGRSVSAAFLQQQQRGGLREQAPPPGAERGDIVFEETGGGRVDARVVTGTATTQPVEDVTDERTEQQVIDQALGGRPADTLVERGETFEQVQEERKEQEARRTRFAETGPGITPSERRVLAAGRLDIGRAQLEGQIEQVQAAPEGTTFDLGLGVDLSREETLTALQNRLSALEDEPTAAEAFQAEGEQIATEQRTDLGLLGEFGGDIAGIASESSERLVEFALGGGEQVEETITPAFNPEKEQAAGDIDAAIDESLESLAEIQRRTAQGVEDIREKGREASQVPVSEADLTDIAEFTAGAALSAPVVRRIPKEIPESTVFDPAAAGAFIGSVTTEPGKTVEETIEGFGPVSRRFQEEPIAFTEEFVADVTTDVLTGSVPFAAGIATGVQTGTEGVRQATGRIRDVEIPGRRRAGAVGGGGQRLEQRLDQQVEEETTPEGITVQEDLEIQTIEELQAERVDTALETAFDTRQVQEQETRLALETDARQDVQQDLELDQEQRLEQQQQIEQDLVQDLGLALEQEQSLALEQQQQLQQEQEQQQNLALETQIQTQRQQQTPISIPEFEDTADTEFLEEAFTGGQREEAFRPSVAAVELGITAEEEPQGEFTGFGIRPIVTGNENENVDLEKELGI